MLEYSNVDIGYVQIDCLRYNNKSSIAMTVINTVNFLKLLTALTALVIIP